MWYQTVAVYVKGSLTANIVIIRRHMSGIRQVYIPGNAGIYQNVQGTYTKTYQVQAYTWYITQYAISCCFTFTWNLTGSHGTHQIVIYLAYIRYIACIFLVYTHIYTYIHIFGIYQKYTRYVLGICRVCDKLCGKILILRHTHTHSLK